jgi:Nucleotidyltransferase domain
MTILPIGDFLPLDAEGYLVNPCRRDVIAPPWSDAVTAIQSAYLHHHADRLHSIYVRGSVARGTAREGLSDIDTLETARTFWEAQLRLYLRAAEAAATVATARDRKDSVKAESDFWILYWGPLAAVEDVGLEKKTAAIEAAMVKFGAALNQRESNPDRRELERLSLALAHAIRDAVGPAFELQAAPATQERFKRP